jgi:hypothetical protein
MLPKRSWTQRLFGGMAFLALAITAAACGGSSKPVAVAGTTTTTVAGRAAGLQPYIACMKSHGVTVTGRGVRGGPGGAPGDTTGGSVPPSTTASTLPPGVTQQQYDAALAACRSLIPARQANPATAAYRNCINLQLQQHGATTLPTNGGGFGGGGFGGGGGAGGTGTTVTPNPALQAAIQACAALRPAPPTTTTRPTTSAA